MSQITGTEPDHWHDEHGRHRMRDPRMVYGNHWKNTSGDWTSADERAYVRHLLAHEAMPTAVEVLPGDDPKVVALVEKIKHDQAMIETETELLAALRSQARHTGKDRHEQ